MKRYTIFFMGLLIYVAIFGRCATMRVEYSLISVPEEGGIRFTKVTATEDGVLYPHIMVFTDEIIYKPRKIFDIPKDGRKIAYIGWKNNKSNIFVKSLEGGKAILQRTFRENIADVSFSPDGKLLAFADYRENSWNIYTIGAESGSAIRQITMSKLADHYPVFSPDSNFILFVQTEVQKVGNQTIYKHYLWTYDLEKGSLTQYSEGCAPGFTPDGKKVIVTRENIETGKEEIWLIDLVNGQEFLILGSKEKGFMEGSVSPDGKRIAVVSKSIGENIPPNLDIFVINIDGTALFQLTFHPGHDVSPRWSPDGNYIYFLSQRGSEKGEYNIWRMTVK